ncbi:MAG: GTP pyrophosphokinase family protein [Bacillota bacterium]|nr:GTP pyrophosphokinase family protein [Bacillota bacterium]
MQEQVLKNAEELLELQSLYKSAIREISTKLEILDDEFQIRFQRDPIHHMECRLKTPTSIFDKLIRKGLEPNLKTARENLTDIAGVRVICNYIDDIYMIAGLLCAQDDISLIRTTDYIKNPKSNGYRSLHIVVHVPVFLTKAKRLVPVEIQIRTIAMDFWASLEHQIHYKACNNVPGTLVNKLKECADTLSNIDIEMQNINKEFQNIGD